MRRSKEDAARTREQIVEAASRLFRQKGITGVSVADVMAACGLTVGGFYKHFKSKDALVAEAIERASLSTTAGGPREAEEIISSYVSLFHAKHPEAGCPIAALCSDIHREHGEPREAFDVALARMFERIAAPRQKQLSMAATAVGAVVLARASKDPKVAEEVLSAARQELLALLQSPRHRIR
jgi:TetR/AcrR family transcriptional repressor of nem operon